MLKGDKITLRPVTENDLPEMIKLGNNLSQRGKYLGVEFWPEQYMKKTFSETGFWDRNLGHMLIVDKTGKIVGLVSYFKSYNGGNWYEIGYQIYKEEDRCKGYTSEAVKIFSSYLFAIYPIERLQIGIFKGNTASEKVAQKCGYTYEGTLRKAIFSNGKHKDLEIFSILREECPPLDEVLK